MIIRILNYIMILLFAFAAAVQFNDENPMFWILGYSAAAILSLLYALQWKIQKIILGLAIISAVWAATIVPDLTLNGFQHMFGDVKMLQSGVKETREILGLLIVCGWMLTLWASSMAPQEEG